MLTVTIALLLQANTATYTLPPMPVDAALVCGKATAARKSTDSFLTSTAQATYFLMQAAFADPQGRPILDRVNELAGQMPSAPIEEAQVPAAIAQCRALYPLSSNSTGKITLPSDPLARDVTCLATLSVLLGAAGEKAKDSGDMSIINRIEAANRPLSEGLTDERLTKANIGDSAAFMNFVTLQIKNTLKQGNLVAYAAACGVPGL